MKTENEDPSHSSHTPSNDGVPSPYGIVIVPSVNRLPLASIEGFKQDVVLKFGKGLNVIYGKSGSGRSRLLGAILQKTDNGTIAKNYTSLDFDFDEATAKRHKKLSYGQKAFANAKRVLSLFSKNQCLLMDEPLAPLDADHRRMLLRSICASNKQAIMTINEWEMDAVRKLCKGHGARFINMNSLRSEGFS